MSRAIKRTYKSNPREPPIANEEEEPTPDDLLIEAYLNSSPPLHARRTLDQFFYHGIDTSDRDQDQVVYRYCRRRNLKPHVFMVDQLWVWILGKGSMLSCSVFCLLGDFANTRWLWHRIDCDVFPSTVESATLRSTESARWHH
jgi:hypothetical protein